MIYEQLEALKLPDMLSFPDGKKVTGKEEWQKRRQEIKNILCTEEYGFLPAAPINVAAEIVTTDKAFCAGKVTLSQILLTLTIEQGTFSFPIYASIPNTNRPCPAFLHINFRDLVPDKYMPVEEICDHGFAVISFCYKDVTSDNNDFTDGLANLIYGGQKRSNNSPGKIAMWAWAAMRVMDYLQTLDSIDKGNIAVVGHSRLGKTALLTGALDERFAFTISNDSGCSGAAISRDKKGETIRNICDNFPYWFCENYQNYIDREYSLPFDQHFLLALTAPRNLYVASAELDTWADPDAEFLSCIAAGGIYEFLGEIGFVCPDRLPQADESFHDGNIGYHVRKGTHYLSRCDWLKFMEYMQKHKIPDAAE